MVESNAWLAAVSADYCAAGIVPYCYDDAGRLFFLLHTEGCGHCPPRAIASARNQASASGRKQGAPRASASACDASKQNQDEEEYRQESANPSDQPQEIVAKQEPDQENEEEQKQASANPADQLQEIVVKQEPDRYNGEEQKQASANPADQSQETAAESGAEKRKRMNDQLRMELAQEDPRSRKKRLEALKAEHRQRESARKRQEKQERKMQDQDQESEEERMRESQSPSDQSQEPVAESGAEKRRRFLEYARMQLAQLAQEDPRSRKKRLEEIKAENRLQEKGRRRQERRRRKMQKNGVFLLDFGGKKEEGDNNSPARTAAREYVEEYEAGYYNLKGASWEKRIADVAAALADQSEAFYSGNSGHVFFLCHADRLNSPKQAGSSVTDNSVIESNGTNSTAGGAVTVKKKAAGASTPAVPASVVARLNARWVDSSKLVDHLLNKKRLKPALHYRLNPSGPTGGVPELVACIARLQEFGNACVNPPAPSEPRELPPCIGIAAATGHENRVAC
ncbi:unnamed protein product [Closterium sp. Yama58-4]|nr:unnamed protein product [Closterium sp. Yama58-4]